MKNMIKGQSSPSSASINFYQFLNKYFFLLFGITYLSIATITTISGNRFCPTNSHLGESTSSNSLEDATLASQSPHKSLTWFYTIIILGCSGTPWLLAYIFRHRASAIAKKGLRCYPSGSTTQKPIPTPVLTPVLSTPNIAISHRSAPSYRISAVKSSAKKNTSLSNRTKNIRLPFERLK